MSSVMYGEVIQQAIASGSLARMKKVAQRAERKLRQEGNVAAALEALKIEIARMEVKIRKSAATRRTS